LPSEVLLCGWLRFSTAVMLSSNAVPRTPKGTSYSIVMTVKVGTTTVATASTTVKTK
jgi:hypothetical protein